MAEINHAIQRVRGTGDMDVHWAECAGCGWQSPRYAEDASYAEEDARNHDATCTRGPDEAGGALTSDLFHDRRGSGRKEARSLGQRFPHLFED